MLEEYIVVFDLFAAALTYLVRTLSNDFSDNNLLDQLQPYSTNFDRLSDYSPVSLANYVANDDTTI